MFHVKPRRDDVSRETRPAWQVRTAADIAEQDDRLRTTTPPRSPRPPSTRSSPAPADCDARASPRPDATRVFVVANQKGGVGKTTSTVNVAAGLAQLGQKVLVIDLDPQGNASTALGVEHHRGVPSTYDMLVEGQPLADVMTECADLPGLWVVPATIDLAGAEIELVSVVAREQRLARAITAHPLVGTARRRWATSASTTSSSTARPSLGLLTLNALVAGREMFIPIQAEYYALEGLGPAARDRRDGAPAPQPAARRVARSCSPCTTPAPASRPASPTRCASHFGDQVLKTAVPRSVRVSEAPSYGQTVMTYDPASAGALSYLEAAREIASKGAPCMNDHPRHSRSRRGLGRGLGSLIPTAPRASAADATGRPPTPTAADRRPT